MVTEGRLEAPGLDPDALELLRAALEDGSSESEILNSRGLSVKLRSRVATLCLEAAGPGRPAVSASVYLAAREARRART